MENRELAERFAAAFNAGDLESVASHLSGDFTFSGPVPEAIGAAEWIGMTRTLKAAFPDIRYNLRVLGVDGDVVETSTQVSGTHTGDLDLSALGLGVIPATGKTFSNPEEKGKAVIRDGKIASIEIHSSERSGVAGILAQIGVQPPEA